VPVGCDYLEGGVLHHYEALSLYLRELLLLQIEEGLLKIHLLPELLYGGVKGLWQVFLTGRVRTHNRTLYSSERRANIFVHQRLGPLFFHYPLPTPQLP
jgi:hypothetical protein